MKQRKNQPTPKPSFMPKAEASTAAKSPFILPLDIPYTQRNAYILLGILAVLTLIIYVPGLNNEFTWDARRYILESPYLAKLPEAEAWFKDKKYGIFSVFELGNYHPVTNFTWAIEYLLVGKSTWLYHLNQALLHIANSYLVFRVMHRLHPNFIIVALTAVLFAVHPLHVESVAWAAERKDTLYMLFMLLSFEYYIRWWQEGAKQQKLVWLALLMFFLACFSKAMAVVLPVVFVLTDVLFFKRKPELKLILEKWAFWLLALGVGLLSVYVQQDAGADATSQINSQYTVFERFRIILYNFTFYWYKMLIPTNLLAFYQYPNKPFPTAFILTMLSTPAILAGLYFYGKKEPRIWWAGGYFIVVIALVIQILPIGSAIVADRYFYASSLGPLYLLAWGLYSLYETRSDLRQVIALGVGTVVLAFTLMSMNRTLDWKNDLSIFTQAYNAYPTNGFMAQNVGWSYMQKKDTLNALKYWEKSDSLGWHNEDMNLKMAEIYGAKFQYAKAAKQYQYVLGKMGKNPQYKNLYWNTANCFYLMNDYATAVTYADSALISDPKNHFAHNVLGLVYTKTGEFGKAIFHLNEAIKFAPKYYDPYVNLSHTYALMGNVPAEIAACEKAIKINPKKPLAYVNMGAAYRDRGDLMSAIAAWKRGAEAMPQNADFCYNIGQMYGVSGDNTNAIIWMRKAVRLGHPGAISVLQTNGISLQ